MRSLVAFALAAAAAVPAAASEPPPAPEPLPAAAAAEGPVLTLAEVVALADRRNTDLVVLRERIEEANANLRQAWAVLLPDATAAATYTRNQASEADFGGRTISLQPEEQWSAVAQITAPLIVVPAWLGVASARDAEELARQTAAQGRADLLFGTAQAYYAAVTAERLVEVATGQLDAAVQAERVAQIRWELGETPKMAFLAAGVERAAAEGDVIRARNAAASAKLALRTLAGIAGPFRLAPVPEVAAPEAAPADLVQTALARRRDLAASRLAVELAERSVKAAFWQFAPTVSANGQYRWTDVTGPFADPETWVVSLTAAFTLFDGGGRLAAVSAARSQERQAEARREGLRRRIVEETERALLDLETARANERKAREQAALARERATLAAVQFEAGAATYLEVTDANAASFAAEVAAVTESFNVSTAALRLSRAIGALVPAA